MKQLSLALFFVSALSFAKKSESPPLCLVLATHYDEIRFNASGDMDSLFFAKREGKKAKESDLAAIVRSDALEVGRLQWTLSRLSSGNLVLPGFTLREALNKSFTQTLTSPDAYTERDKVLKEKLSLEKVQNFRKLKESTLHNFVSEFQKLCGENFIEVVL